MRALAKIPTPIGLCVLLLCGACAAQQGDVGSAPAADEPPPAAATEEAETGVGDVPVEILDAIVGDLAATEGVEPSEIEVVRAEAVTWNDASLGCPEPGQMYIQMLTEGYWVILRHGGEEHDYRATRGGSFVLCERSDRREPVRE